MNCEVRYFGMIAEQLKKTEEYISFLELSNYKNELKLFFKEKYPILNTISFSIAVNDIITDKITSEKIKTIALLPPFAGG